MDTCIQINNSQSSTSKGLKDRALFLSDYASVLMGSGVHTSRVIRNTKRIGDAMEIDVKISNLHRSLILSATNRETEENYNSLAEIPHYPISFEINTNLSALSWQAYDEELSFDEIKKRYTQLISKPKLHSFVILILSSLANASFCALFGGDFFSIGIVFSATLTGMFAKQQLLKKGVNTFLTFIISAFIASIMATTSIIFETTSDVAVATSVLFLIPGVPLINGFMDIMEGHVITGSARLINALLLIICIGIGLSGTIMLVKNNLI